MVDSGSVFLELILALRLRIEYLLAFVLPSTKELPWVSLVLFLGL